MTSLELTKEELLILLTALEYYRLKLPANNLRALAIKLYAELNTENGK